MSPKKSISKPIEGTRLAYSVKDLMAYRKKLKSLTRRMAEETKREILKLFGSKLAEEYIDNQKMMSALDESIASQARILINSLTKKYQQLFSGKSTPYAQEMVNQSLIASNNSLNASLKALSISVTLKSTSMSSSLREICKASVTENVGLIESIPQEYMKNVQGTVMRTITSGGDIQLLTSTLNKYAGISDRKAKNIADDQVRKSYNSINRQRMLDVGVKKFKWLHSGGGQKPRQDHIDMSGNIYSFDDLPVIDKNTGETGIPGQAINCRCTMTPVFDFEIQDPNKEYKNAA